MAKVNFQTADTPATIVNTASGSLVRRDVDISVWPIPDAWHAAMRATSDDDKNVILEVWHLAHDLRDKLLALKLAE